MRILFTEFFGAWFLSIRIYLLVLSSHVFFLFNSILSQLLPWTPCQDGLSMTSLIQLEFKWEGPSYPFPGNAKAKQWSWAKLGPEFCKSNCNITFCGTSMACTTIEGIWENWNPKQNTIILLLWWLNFPNISRRVVNNLEKAMLRNGVNYAHDWCFWLWKECWSRLDVRLSTWRNFVWIMTSILTINSCSSKKNYLGPTILCCTSMIFCTCLFGSVISPQTVIIHESNLHDTFDQMSILPGKIFQLFWYFTLMPKFLAKSLFSSRCVVHHFCIPKNILSWRTWRRETFSWTRSGFCSKVKTIYLGPSTTRLALWRYFLGLA